MSNEHEQFLGVELQNELVRIQDQIAFLLGTHPSAFAAPADAGSAGSAGSTLVHNSGQTRGVSSSSVLVGQAVNKAVTGVCLDADTDVEESLGVPPANPVKEKALLRPNGRGEEPAKDPKGGKRSRSPSMSESSESIAQQPREEPPVKINSTVGKSVQGQHWQDDDGAQRALAMDIEAIEVVKRTVRPKAKSMIILGLMIEGKGENLIRDDQVIDLVHVREHEMAQENIEQFARAIE